MTDPRKGKKCIEPPQRRSQARKKLNNVSEEESDITEDDAKGKKYHQIKRVANACNLVAPRTTEHTVF